MICFDVNLRNSLYAGRKARKRGIHPGFETQGRRYQKSKTGVSVAPQKGLMSSKIKKKVICFDYVSGVHSASYGDVFTKRPTNSLPLRSWMLQSSLPAQACQLMVSKSLHHLLKVDTYEGQTFVVCFSYE